MSGILTMLKKFEAINTDKICVDTVKESADAIEVKNKEQMYAGESSTGGDILPEYKPLTVFIKTRKGQPTDRVTLHDTGSFYQGLYVSVNNDRIVTGSTDSKTEKLEDKYGENIFGLNDKFSIEVVQETMKPIFKEKIEAATGLKMR